jgi:hypothetical protein
MVDFIQSGAYKAWVHDAAPRVGVGANPHGNALHVYYNDLAVAAGVQGIPEVGGMVVKEIYAEGGTELLSVAARQRIEGTWVNYCSNPGSGLCTSGAETGGPDPFYGSSDDSSCAGCHSDNIYSRLPE